MGCYNSGTTLLARLLASHPHIGGLPDEGVYYTDALPYPEQFGWSRMWHRCVERVRLTPEDAVDVRRIVKQWSFWFSSCGPNLVEKSVVNSVRMPFLNSAFQPAYFISIVRNGYAVAEGIRRKAQPSRWGNREFPRGYPLELCAQQWVESAEWIERDRAEIPRFLQVKYEALTTSPRSVLSEIAEFLGISEFPEGMTHQNWRLQGRDQSIRDLNAESFGRLSEAEIDGVRSVADKWLRYYGYQPPKAGVTSNSWES